MEMFEEKLGNLKRELVEYAGLVESMIEKAVKGLLDREPDYFVDVIEKDEPRANTYEVEIDEMGTALIAQHEPKAKDLRTILMVMKMSNDLERMGDHAVNIAQSGMYLIERPLVKPSIDVPRMSGLTIGMLKDSIVAFINEDPGLAKSVCERDSEVDELRDQLFRELITYMVSDAKTIERSLHLTRVAGNLERIADLSTNICEDVIFMVKGQVIKHHQSEDEEPGT
jgi:phosphate transport system protein